MTCRPDHWHPFVGDDAIDLRINVVRPADVTEESHEINSHHATPVESEETSGSEADVDEPRPAAPARRQLIRLDKAKATHASEKLFPFTPCTRQENVIGSWTQDALTI